MSTKNKHNQLGSDIERSDDRIRQTGEVFTPEECIHKMVDSLSEYQLKNDMFLDYCAGNGNFSSVLIDRGVPQSHIYDYEVIWRIISLNCAIVWILMIHAINLS